MAPHVDRNEFVGLREAGLELFGPVQRAGHVAVDKQQLWAVRVSADGDGDGYAVAAGRQE